MYIIYSSYTKLLILNAKVWIFEMHFTKVTAEEFFKIRLLRIDVGSILQQISETGGGFGRASGGHDHVNGPATLRITAVEPPQLGLHQELNRSQLAVKAGHMER